MAQRRGRQKTAKRKIMLVQGDSTAELADAISVRGHKVVRAGSAEEASRLLEDAIYIGTSFDALLADCHLGDTSVLRVIRDFRNEFKFAPVGLMANHDDIATAIWANTKGIPILEKPLREPELLRWLSHLERDGETIPA